MALDPVDEIHALQIQAGTLGRQTGHLFEDHITQYINQAQYPIIFSEKLVTHVNIGEPACLLLNYIASTFGHDRIEQASAISTGALATSEDGKKWLEINGIGVRRCKSDLIITIKFPDGEDHTVGVSTKQCNTKTPTNAQLYFTTARGFSNLLNSNNIVVSPAAINSMRQFCGDAGFRPLDALPALQGRKTDPRRFFWEETDPEGRSEWEKILTKKQNEITKLLLQKAYIDDLFPPEFLVHKTKKSAYWDQTEIALYTIDELLFHSNNYNSFVLKPYSVRKGSYKDPPGITHMAPRFGIIQMQRGGQAQHPEQLQFNLEAGYFYKIKQTRPDMHGEDSGQ